MKNRDCTKRRPPNLMAHRLFKAARRGLPLFFTAPPRSRQGRIPEARPDAEDAEAGTDERPARRKGIGISFRVNRSYRACQAGEGELLRRDAWFEARRTERSAGSRRVE